MKTADLSPPIEVRVFSAFEDKLIGAAAIILNLEGHVLLVKHSYGKYNWELPGGLSEAQESAEESARREVLEETGLKVTPESLTGVYYDPGMICTILYSLAKKTPIKHLSPARRRLWSANIVL